MLWVPISILAGFIQAVRNALQKSLTKHLPTEMVTWSRFLFGLPVALVYVALLHSFGSEIPIPGATFWFYCFLAGLSQITGNILLIHLFTQRNFVVGVTYTKVEAIMSALLAALLFGEMVTFGGFLAIIIGMIGIVLISVTEQHVNPLKLIKNAANKIAVLGVVCGCFYALTGVLIRQASILLTQDGHDVMMSAAITLTAMLAIQTVVLGLWILVKYRKKMAAIGAKFKHCSLVGLTNTLSSICWFTAFTLTQTAYVMAVGQVEIIFSLLMGHKIFQERTSMVEYAGIVLVISSILLLIFVH